MTAPAPGPLFRRRAGLVVGVVHLPPLPGSPRWGGDLAAVLERARADLLALAEGGVDAAIVENFGDAPFRPGAVEPETVAAMARALTDLRRVRAALPDAPLLVGSGVTEDTIREALAVADGVIVGTSLKVGGVTTAPVDAERVRRLVAAAKG